MVLIYSLIIFRFESDISFFNINSISACPFILSFNNRLIDFESFGSFRFIIIATIDTPNGSNLLAISGLILFDKLITYFIIIDLFLGWFIFIIIL